VWAFEADVILVSGASDATGRSACSSTRRLARSTLFSLRQCGNNLRPRRWPARNRTAEGFRSQRPGLPFPGRVRHSPAAVADLDHERRADDRALRRQRRDLHCDSNSGFLRCGMWCVFQATDDPRVHRGARCGFITAPTRFSPDRVRRKCNATSLTTLQMPSFAERVRSYREARETWISAGRQVRSEEEMARLHAICRTCAQFSGASCKLCGCAIHPSRTWLNKLYWATENCPDVVPRW